MSMEIRLFQDPNRGMLSFKAMRDRLATLPGLAWDQLQPHYAPFTIRDDHTGAWAFGDLGQPIDLEQDDVHPEKTYADVHDLQVRLSLPLVAPTWIVDCACSWLNALAIPGLLVLDIEDTRDPQGADGPSPLHPPRLAASWAAQHLTQCKSLLELPRLSAAASASLFRYRQARGSGSAWPQIQVLGHGNDATTVCVWPEDTVHWHLPPVEWVTTRAGEVFASSAVVGAAGDPPPDEKSLARPVSVRRSDLQGPDTNLDSWHWCGDGEWADALPLDG